MKKIIILLLISIIGNAQENNKEILNLEKSKTNLINKISEINDSIEKINLKIASFNVKKIENMISSSAYSAIVRKGAKLKKNPKAMGEVILTFEDDKKVAILDYYNEYFGVCADTICGYMNEVWVIKDEPLNNLIKLKRFEESEIIKLETENKRKKQQNETAELEKNYIKRFGKTVYSKLKENRFWIGMTKEMAIISLGSPNDINRTVGTWGVHEQWIYENRYLYFENGKLTSYQN